MRNGLSRNNFTHSGKENEADTHDDDEGEDDLVKYGRGNAMVKETPLYENLLDIQGRFSYSRPALTPFVGPAQPALNDYQEPL
jgi:hypothetical protein